MLINVDDLAIVEGVIALAKSFKREVIAEGVETIEHGTALLQLGCELAQGYGIARPMPASDIPAWISRWEPDISWRNAAWLVTLLGHTEARLTLASVWPSSDLIQI
jgi:predicted signal transduction protein with EAL and GGDEF domain